MISDWDGRRSGVEGWMGVETSEVPERQREQMQVRVSKLYRDP